MQAGGSTATREIDAQTPVLQIMEMIRDGATDIAVTHSGQRIGHLTPAHVMGRLINPRG
jgi:glycine betaine/proline transport system ATP-binding protein